MDADKVRYSRAGDAFHYRWAARRCLRLIDFDSPVHCIKIEGSKEPDLDGEAVIDLAEYKETDDGDDEVEYTQLKHSSSTPIKNFTFSSFESTLKGFGKRYSSLIEEGILYLKVHFTLATNRPVSEELKEAVSSIASGLESQFTSKFENATGFSGNTLSDFCKKLFFDDKMGDYIAQRDELRGEMSEYLPSAPEENSIDGIIALVISRVLPKSKENPSGGEIIREDILGKIGAINSNQLFPAKPRLETAENLIVRKQHEQILSSVLSAKNPTIIHAPGGVGKSVVCRQLLDSLPSDSFGLIYDCFGAGSYRNESTPRHKAHEAFTEVTNELAVKGLCNPLIPVPNASYSSMFQVFLKRIKQAVDSLRVKDPNAKLVIIFDAVDNAEMAAEEFGTDRCFASALLRETIPDGCAIVMTSRSERIELLSPSSDVTLIQLDPFDENETFNHLTQSHAEASRTDSIEFHRLTHGNPRVQSNALSNNNTPLPKILEGLGPGITVDEQIESQLDSAIAKITERQPSTYSSQIHAICEGLSNLPPFIPIDVLSKASGVTPEAILSFVSDLGRPLWVSDNSVQFRDEPTETWFLRKFRAEKEKISDFARRLEPFAENSTYVSRSLPQLYFQAGEYDQLVESALSDTLLPTDNPVDARNIRIYRLQYAFKASVKLSRLGDSCKIAFRAGEEVAGENRQIEILRNNTDLFPLLQSPEQTQELASSYKLKSSWQGSANLYTASILSSIQNYKGEARGFLRSAERWLDIHFSKKNANDDEDEYKKAKVTDSDILEFTWSHLNLHGVEAAVNHIQSWRPPTLAFVVSQGLCERLIDQSRFEEIDELTKYSTKNPFTILAASHALLSVGRLPNGKHLKRTLSYLASRKSRIYKSDRFSNDDTGTSAVISLCEAAAAENLSTGKILCVLGKYTKDLASNRIADDYNSGIRSCFLRGIALRSVVRGTRIPRSSSLIESKGGSNSNTIDDDEETTQKDIISALLPLYFIRAKAIVNKFNYNAPNIIKLQSKAESIFENNYRIRNLIPWETATIVFNVLAISERVSKNILEKFTNTTIETQKSKFKYSDRFKCLRIANRKEHLYSLRKPLESTTCKIVGTDLEDSPEEIADQFIQLARALLPLNLADSSAYFHEAIEAVSKFGDEAVQRWIATNACAKSAAGHESVTSEHGYRFIRCAEIIGQTVAREKYWDRSDALASIAKLDPPSAIAALSRWRDRRVGWLEEQLPELIYELLELGKISPSTAFSMSGFLGCYAHINLALLCITKEQSKSNRAKMISHALRDASLSMLDVEKLKTLESVTTEFPVLHNQFEDILNESKIDATYSRDDYSSYKPTPRDTDPRIGELIKKIDVLDSKDLEQATFIVHRMEPPREIDQFWEVATNSVPEGKEVTFLDSYIKSDAVNWMDTSRAVPHFRSQWKDVISVRKNWCRFFRKLGKRLSLSLCSIYRLSHIRRDWDLTKKELDSLHEGLSEGLADHPSFNDAETLFGYIENTTNKLSRTEALEVLEFSLQRFEQHIGEDFGDGEWADWLEPPASTAEAIAGFLWSALGSPYSFERWQACHSVVRLVALNNLPEIRHLFRYFEKETVDSFGHNDYPFYAAHSKLYFLIALSRATNESLTVLSSFSDEISNIALNHPPHALIQKMASEVALKVESNRPNTYDQITIDALANVGISPFPVRHVHSRFERTDSPWHDKGQVNTDIDLSFGMDFDSYWFNQLAGVFGMHGNQIEELAKELAVQEYDVSTEERFPEDPRQSQWNSLSQYDYSTHHSHGSYPSVDSFRFYYSYHSFLAVASKLLNEVPIIIEENWGDEEDKWEHWLERHSITRKDGFWLADRRDRAPFQRRKWIQNPDHSNWICSLQKADFKDAIVHRRNEVDFLYVDGYWTDITSSLVETINVKSALVNRESAEALATSLRLSKRSHDYSLPFYEDFRDEISVSSLFELNGWIHHGEGDSDGLDSFDPHGKEISYPAPTIGDSYARLLNLVPDDEKRVWRSIGNDTPLAISETWSEKPRHPREKTFRKGKRISSSVNMIMDLCSKTGKDLIVSVKIERRIDRSYSSNGDKLPYIEPSHEVFVFSENGLLRDATESHKIS